MKTATYLRLSLLIPFIVWGISIPLFFLLAALSPESSGSTAFTESAKVIDYGLTFLVFYIFGIVIWIFPYLLLALIFFFWSFIGQARAMIKVFALSPLAMTVLTVAVAILMDLGNPGVSRAFANRGQLDQNFVDFNLLITGVTFAWSYICVGLGYGIYKLLGRLGIVRDQAVRELTSTSEQPA